MADVNVDEDAAGRNSNTGEESSKSGQPGSKVLFWRGLSEGEALTTPNRRNRGRGLGVMA